MKKEILLKLVEKGFSTRELAKELNTSQTNIRHWLNKFGLKTKSRLNYFELGEKFCPYCNLTKPLEDFYINKSRLKPHGYCKDCNRLNVIKRQRRIKEEAVTYKGGKCSTCGYSKYLGALEFHHLDPKLKDSDLFSKKCKNFDDKMKAELDKCILLCANCHAEIHKK